MLRSLLVALDGSDTSVAAGRLALELAHRHKAHVEGLGIVNTAWINRPEPMPIGGSAFKAASSARRIRSASEQVTAVMETFRKHGESMGVSSLEVREANGDPKEVLQVESTSHDLLVLGRNSMFDAETDMSELPLYVDQIIRDEPRPVLLVPERGQDGGAAHPFGPVLVAFDGSPASSRALHMFALLGLAPDQPIHVMTLDDESRDNAVRIAERGCLLLRRHGASQVHPIGLGDREAGTASEAILGTAKTLGAQMIVMGAYGHRGLRELFGSCTRSILRSCPVPLFLHH